MSVIASISYMKKKTKQNNLIKNIYFDTPIYIFSILNLFFFFFPDLICLEKCLKFNEIVCNSKPACPYYPLIYTSNCTTHYNNTYGQNESFHTQRQYKVI